MSRDNLFKLIEKPIKDRRDKVYDFVFPYVMKKKATIISINRGIKLAKFVREAIEIHVKKYKNMIY